MASTKGGGSKSATKTKGGSSQPARASRPVPRVLARAAVAKACAAATHFVQVSDREALKIIPSDLESFSLQEVGISDIQAFKALLRTFLPFDLHDEVAAMQLTVAVNIGLIINYLEFAAAASAEIEEIQILG